MFNMLGNERSRSVFVWPVGMMVLMALTVLQGSSSCDAPVPCQGDGEIVAVLTSENSGEALEICVGDQFEFTFNYAGNAAFDYEVTALDENVVRQVGAYSDPPPDGCYDCPSLVHWVFEGYAPGETQLEVSIVNLDGEVMETYIFDVTVG